MSSFPGPAGGGASRSNARGERTRGAIVDALLDLVADGDLKPTVPRVADRAGLSLRTVFHHFNEVEALLEAALERQLERAGFGPARLPAGLSESSRLDRLVKTRSRIFESTMAIRRAAQASVPHAPRLGERLTGLCRLEREELLSVFGEAIPQLPAAERAVAEAALAVAGSFSTWEALRVQLGLGPEAARRTLHRLLASQLSLAVDA